MMTIIAFIPVRTRMRLIVCLALLATISGQGNPQDSPISVERSQSFADIEGHVVNLLSGEPVRRASLTLQPRGRPAGNAVAAVSDSKGEFSFAGINPGVYTLSAERPGFLRQEYGTRRPLSAGTPITVGPGQHIRDLDLKLMPHGIISGKLLDEEGDPVTNVAVQVLRRAGSSGSVWQKVDDAETNDLGEFRIAGLSPGSYLLAADRPSPVAALARPPEQADEEFVPSFYPGVTDAVSAVPLQVAAGEEVSTGNFLLRKAKVYRIEGRVASEGAASSRNVQLILLPHDRAAGGLGFEPLTTTVRPDGLFEVRSVQPGSYDLTAIRAEGKRQVLGRMPLEVTSGNIDGLTFPLTEGSVVTGTVHVEGQGKTVLTQIRVVLLPAVGQAFIPISGPVNGDGNFQIEGVPRDVYCLQFLRLPEGAYVKSARTGGENVLDKGLDLSHGGTEPLQITLSGKGGTIEGRVLAEGKPAPPSEVTLVPDPPRPYQPHLYKKVTTAQDGRFMVTGLAPGDYKLIAWEAATAPDMFTEPGNSENTGGTKISVREGGREQIELQLFKSETSHIP